MKYDRRKFLQNTIIFTGATMTVAVLPPAQAMLPELKETDPEAIAIGYYRNARNVDKNKFPTFEAGQTCANCALVGFSSAMRKPCKLIPDKLVYGGGWCAQWVKKA